MPFAQSPLTSPHAQSCWRFMREIGPSLCPIRCAYRPMPYHRTTFQKLNPGMSHNVGSLWYPSAPEPPNVHTLSVCDQHSSRFRVLGCLAKTSYGPLRFDPGGTKALTLESETQCRRLSTLTKQGIMDRACFVWSRLLARMTKVQTLYRLKTWHKA